MLNIKELKELCSTFNVLLVDDELDALEALHAVLSTLFLHVEPAENGAIALEKYKSMHYDLIITDLNMPVMDGFEFIDEVRKLNLMQRIIILSAKEDKESLLNGIKYSVDGYILKPVQQEQIVNSITKVANLLKIEQENKSYRMQLEDKVKEQLEKIENQSKKLLTQLQYDTLTLLPNKQKLYLDFDSEDFKELILINIDNFENINIAYGFEAGDEIIKQVSLFLNDLIDEHHLYYLRGDEFVIAITSDDADSYELAELIKNRVYTKSFNLSHAAIRLTFTFGIVTLEEEQNIPFHKLHMAVKEVRLIGKNRVGYYKDGSLFKKQQNIQFWSQKIKHAYDMDMIEPFFQPIYDVKNKKIHKYECLARIVDNDEIITPDKFLEAAKISGFLTSITRRMIDKSFQYFSSSDMQFSINITDDDLKEEYLPEYLEYASKKYNIEPKNVTLEILENISEYDAVHAINQLQELQSLGYRLSIDDFGAESSNFARTQKLFINYIKIDGSFIKDIDINLTSLNITSTIIYFAKKTNVKVIAEFVHSQEIYDILEEFGVDYVQGYFIGQPQKDILEL